LVHRRRYGPQPYPLLRQGTPPLGVPAFSRRRASHGRRPSHGPSDLDRQAKHTRPPGLSRVRAAGQERQAELGGVHDALPGLAASAGGRR
jgi:hypothetical protein